MATGRVKTINTQSGQHLFVKPQKQIREKRTIKQLAMINQTVKALVLTSTKIDASKLLNISQQALFSRLVRYPEIQATLENYKQKTLELVKNKIVFATEEASDKVISLIKAKSESIQLEASKDILDRAGIIKPVNNNIQVNILNDLKKDAETYS